MLVIFAERIFLTVHRAFVVVFTYEALSDGCATDKVASMEELMVKCMLRNWGDGGRCAWEVGAHMWTHLDVESLEKKKKSISILLSSSVFSFISGSSGSDKLRIHFVFYNLGMTQFLLLIVFLFLLLQNSTYIFLKMETTYQ